MIFCHNQLFVTVYQEFIAPLFDKFSPLPEGALHTSILSLTSSLSFPLKTIQVVEGSKTFRSHDHVMM